MKNIIILGTGNSGASALNDYLLSREDFKVFLIPGNLDLLMIQMELMNYMYLFIKTSV